VSLDDPFGRLRQRDEAAYQQMRERLREAGITQPAAIEAVFRRARRNALLFAGAVVLAALMLSVLAPHFAPLILAVALLALAMAVKAILQSRRLLGRLLADTGVGSAPDDD
jgi:predicted MFS family arabinose efflux permease